MASLAPRPPPPPSSSSSSSHPQQGQGQNPNQPYFIDTKKGEVTELKQLLKNIAVERDPKRKRDVIKKVIAYMTLGIDVSRLFTEMVMAIETRDLVVKKMVYLYLCNYARGSPDLAIMAVNTLVRDASSEDPMVRGLALRSLCSLRLPSMIEYITEPLRRALTDASAYVRRTGVMGILKLFHLAPEVVKTNNYVDLLYNMIQDQDLHVVTNCLIVLNEILAEEGGMAVNQPLILHLLGRVGEFNEWGLTHVLALVAKYAPADEEELFSIMNLLDPVLRTSNSGVVLGTIKCFLHLTTAVPELQPQVYMRVKAPVLTLMAGGNPEVEYCILKHLEAMVYRAPGVFDDEYRQLYVRYNEPSFVKYEKIGILALLANEASVGEIVSELAEYASDIDQEVSRRSIRAIGKIAFRLPGAAGMIMSKLTEFLEVDMNSIRPETILVMKDLLRRYPERKTEVLPCLQKGVLRRVCVCEEHPEAMAAVIWMLGEWGEDEEIFPEAPYILEEVVDMYVSGGGIESVCVKLNLLTATMKLFFKRPPEVQGMLGRLLVCVLNDGGGKGVSQDLHDRALLYYRLLSVDVSVAKKVVVGLEENDGGKTHTHTHTSRTVVSSTFAEERDVTNLREKLFAEFNTLSVLYGKPSAQFVGAGYLVKAAETNLTPFLAGGGGGGGESGGNGGGGGGGIGGGGGSDLLDLGADDSLLPRTPLGEGEEGGEGEKGGGVEATYTGPSMDLLDMGGLGQSLPPLSSSSSTTPPHTQTPTHTQSTVPSLTLIENVQLAPEAFQELWSSYPEAGTFNVDLAALPAGGLVEIEEALARRKIVCLASGDLPEVYKLFLYAQEEGGEVFLVQAVLEKAGRRLDVCLKMKGVEGRIGGGGEMVEAFVDQISQALDSLGLL